MHGAAVHCHTANGNGEYEIRSAFSKMRQKYRLSDSSFVPFTAIHRLYIAKYITRAAEEGGRQRGLKHMKWPFTSMIFFFFHSRGYHGCWPFHQKTYVRKTIFFCTEINRSIFESMGHFFSSVLLPHSWKTWPTFFFIILHQSFIKPLTLFFPEAYFYQGSKMNIFSFLIFYF